MSGFEFLTKYWNLTKENLITILMWVAVWEFTTAFSRKVWRGWGPATLAHIRLWWVFRNHRTCVVTSPDPGANWDWQTYHTAREILLGSVKKCDWVQQDHLADLLKRVSRPQSGATVNLIIFGSPARLPLAGEFLDQLEKGALLRLKFVRRGNKSLNNYVVNVDQFSSDTGYLPWPGIFVQQEQNARHFFPRYPDEGDLRPRTYRGCDYGIVLVRRKDLTIGNEPSDLKIRRVVMIMGFSGPGTLAAAVAYLKNPQFFEPRKGKTVFSVVEVPVVCSEESKDRDLRFVPMDSSRIVHCWPADQSLWSRISTRFRLPHALHHPELRLGPDLQTSTQPSVAVRSV
jgi:hypothetical protein